MDQISLKVLCVFYELRVLLVTKMSGLHLVVKICFDIYIYIIIRFLRESEYDNLKFNRKVK